jgi:unsaturated chondroitin disaccharide hydrolase
MLQSDNPLRPADLLPAIRSMWEASAGKIHAIERTCPPGSPSPVFTVDGTYTAQGWTEWTQGFQFGSAILQYDATGQREFLDIGRDNTASRMTHHLTHTGVHDHGFNNVSTYGNLLRLMNEGRLEEDSGNPWQRRFYEVALQVSGSIQASRWTPTADGLGFIYSFNGPQSLFIDTLRSCRSLALAHALGGVLMGERDCKINLLERLVLHATATACYNVFYGEGRDAYDTLGRVCHEALFNPTNGDFRVPSTQQGYSPFSTWTRGLAWAMLGFAEQLEFLDTRSDEELAPLGGRETLEQRFRKAAHATCEFYVRNSPTDGIPYWDTGAPGLARMPDWPDRPADPFNPHEPVDSSAAAIASQGLLRFGHWLETRGEMPLAGRYVQAGLTVLRTLLAEPYLATDPQHQGLILHSIYHRPNGWDQIPAGQSVPSGQSSMWGDYHAREAALYVQRLAENKPRLSFLRCVPQKST